MRSDIVPGAIFPDYELSDHTAKRSKLSELQGQHPMVLVLSRGGFAPRTYRAGYVILKGIVGVLRRPIPTNWAVLCYEQYHSSYRTALFLVIGNECRETWIAP